LLAFEMAHKTVPVAPVGGFSPYHYFGVVKLTLDFALVATIVRQPLSNVSGNSVFRGFGDNKNRDLPARIFGMNRIPPVSDYFCCGGVLLRRRRRRTK